MLLLIIYVGCGDHGELQIIRTRQRVLRSTRAPLRTNGSLPARSFKNITVTNLPRRRSDTNGRPSLPCQEVSRLSRTIVSLPSLSNSWSTQTMARTPLSYSASLLLATLKGVSSVPCPSSLAKIARLARAAKGGGLKLRRSWVSSSLMRTSSSRSSKIPDAEVLMISQRPSRVPCMLSCRILVGSS